MSASYPSAIKTFSAITRGTTKLEAVLFADVALELDALTQYVGANPHGRSGSLTHRLALAMGYNGSRGNLKACQATDGQRARIRCGWDAIDCATLTPGTYSSLGTYTFRSDVPVLKTNDFYVFLRIQGVADDLSVDTIPALVNFVQGSGTISPFQFQYRVATRKNNPPAKSSSFILHWIAIEQVAGTAGY